MSAQWSSSSLVFTLISYHQSVLAYLVNTCEINQFRDSFYRHDFSADFVDCKFIES